MNDYLSELENDFLNFLKMFGFKLLDYTCQGEIWTKENITVLVSISMDGKVVIKDKTDSILSEYNIYDALTDSCAADDIIDNAKQYIANVVSMLYDSNCAKGLDHTNNNVIAKGIVSGTFTGIMYSFSGGVSSSEYYEKGSSYASYTHLSRQSDRIKELCNKVIDTPPDVDFSPRHIEGIAYCVFCGSDESIPNFNNVRHKEHCVVLLAKEILEEYE